MDFLVVHSILEDGFSVYLETFLIWYTFTMPIPSIANYQHIDLQLKVESFNTAQTIANIACVFMEEYESFLLRGILLFDEPANELKAILSINYHIIEQHVSLTRVLVQSWIVFRISEGLIRSIWHVEHSVLHEEYHEQHQSEEEASIECEFEHEPEKRD